MSLTPYYDMVENIIKELGVDPVKCRGEQAGQWNLRKGSADVWIDVFKNDKGHGYFQVIAPVSPIPQANVSDFYAEVLEASHKLYGVGMTKFREWIYVKTIRETDGLDQDEMRAQINRIGFYADDYDDYFKNKYFGGGGNDRTDPTA